MNDDNGLDLLDLDDNGAMDTLPDATPFATPRPKKPWLLLGVGLVIIVLATYVIIRAIGDDSAASIEVDLDAPVVMDAAEPVDMNVMPPAQLVQAQPQPVQVQQPVQVLSQPIKVQSATQPVAKESQPVVQPKAQPEVATVGVPVRVVEERKEVKFNPVAKEKPVAKPAAKKVAAKSTAQTVSKPVVGAWYVQFGSYSTRALAESAQRQIQNAHKSLFQGHQFVILAAQLNDGKTTYRLRIAFKTSSDANGFCRNAKSDGLDCYVAK